MSREDIEEAIEVLEDASAEMLGETGNENYYGEAITALRKALETEQEPVAWMYEWDSRKHLTFTDQRFVEQAHPHFNKSTPLYTAPLKKEWVGLTDEEKEKLVEAFYGTDIQRLEAVEAKLKEKNGG